MLRRWFRLHGRPATLLFSLLAAGFVLTVIAYPDQAFQASLQGLRLWWDQVFPALLPVLVITELLLGFGMVHALGILLEPLFRFFFRMPGTAGWALAAGLVGGYPLGADATSKLRRMSAVSRREGQRLLAWSHLANPMLVVGVVGAGFLRSPEAGVLLLLLHYAAAAAAALLDRLFAGPAPLASLHEREDALEEDIPAPAEQARGSWGRRMVRTMEAANRQDGRAFGKLLGDAVTNSIQALMMIGGLMMMFSVAIRILEIHTRHLPASGLAARFLPAVLEPHLGTFSLSRLTELPHALQAAGIGAILAWGGLSVHAQVMTFVKGTGLRYTAFLRFRLLHALSAFLLTLPAWEPLGRLLQGTEAVFSPDTGWARLPQELPGGWSLRGAVTLWGGMLSLLVLLLSAMLLLSLLVRFLERTSSGRRRKHP